MLHSDTPPTGNTISMPSWPESFLPGTSFFKPLHSKRKPDVGAPDWQSPCHRLVDHVLVDHIAMGHMQISHVLVGYVLMNHMLTPKKAGQVSFCCLLKADFIFPKHREITLKVVGTKEHNKCLQHPIRETI